MVAAESTLPFCFCVKIGYHNEMTAVSENAHIDRTKHPTTQKGPPPPIASEIRSWPRHPLGPCGEMRQSCASRELARFQQKTEVQNSSAIQAETSETIPGACLWHAGIAAFPSIFYLFVFILSFLCPLFKSLSKLRWHAQGWIFGFTLGSCRQRFIATAVSTPTEASLATSQWQNVCVSSAANRKC